jgi:glycosyltransferase involved in cell wall biosynthesis
MRIAWFSPLPPVRSGIATYSAELLPRLGPEFDVHCFVDYTSEPSVRGDQPSPGRSPTSGAPAGGRRVREGPLSSPEARAPVLDAHDFVWKHQREPYDLVVYQLGNAPCHDYMWAYLARYPGLVVLHDARLHQARARRLLNQKRFADYRDEFWYDHPDAAADFVEYAIEGLGGPIYYFWPMLRVVMRTARAIAVHNERVAADLREQHGNVPVEAIRMGVAAFEAARGASLDAEVETRARVRRELELPDRALLFAAFGRVTAEKRILPILGALGALVAEGANAFLLLVGDAAAYPTLAEEIQGCGLGDRVRITGFVRDDAIGGYLAAADACLCLRWPTAEETSASWLRCLAAARATVITDLAHLVDIPTLDPSRRGSPPGGSAPIAVRIDLIEEEESLRTAMRRLATDTRLRESLGRAGHAYWAREHTLEVMVADYRRVIKEAAARPAPAVAGLPAHFTNDYTGLARRIARQFGVEIDLLRSNDGLEGLDV